MTIQSSSLIHGLGSLRFNPETVPEDQIRLLAEIMIENAAIGTFLRGPIRFYGRGEKDVRLEYDFRIPDNVELAESFYQNIRMIVQEVIPVIDKWYHSHWTGVEHIS